VDGEESSRTLAADLRLTFPLGTDTTLSLIRHFGVEMAGRSIALPASFVLVAEGGGGRIAYAHVGATNADRPAVDELMNAVRAARGR